MTGPDLPDGLPRSVTSVDDACEVAEDDEERDGIQALARAAHEYLAGFDWCGGIEELWWADGVAPHVGILLVRIDARAPADEWLWLVVGDLPAAYLVTDDMTEAADVLDTYVAYRWEWVEAVESGASTEDTMPVDIAETPESAALLRGRLELLETWLDEGVFGVRPE